MSVRAAKRYAKALLDLASDTNQGDVVYKDMQLIVKSIAENTELSLLLESPVYKISDKKKALLAVFSDKVNSLTTKLFALLEKNKRMGLLQRIAEQYQIQYNDKKGVVEASVITAFELDQNLRDKILSKAKELAKGKEINLKTKVDKAIIGGFILRVGDEQIDASVLNKINNLKRELKQ